MTDMSTEKQTQEADRQRIWNELAAEEAAGDVPGLAQPSHHSDAPTKQDDTAAQQQPATDSVTGIDAQPDAAPERFASMTQQDRDYIAGLEATVQRLNERMRANEGSIGGLKSELQRQREAAKAAREAGSSAPTDAQLANAQAGGQRAMDKLREQYPEFADHLDAVFNERLAKSPDSSSQQPRQQAVSQEEVLIAKREAYIEGKGFKNWSKQIASPEFVGWFSRQPREVKLLGYSEDWDDAVRLLEIHREQTSARSMGDEGDGGAARRGRDLGRFSGISELHQGRQQGFRGTKSIDQMTPAEYWKHLNDLDAQQSN